MGYNETTDDTHITKSLRIPREVYPKIKERHDLLGLNWTSYVTMLIEIDMEHSLLQKPTYYKPPEEEKPLWWAKKGLTSRS